MSQSGPDIHAGLRDLLLEYEQTDAAWRGQHRLNSNEQLVLMLLAEGFPGAPTRLADAIGITTAGMTGLLDRLESGGFVRREPHPTDGRKLLITLTKQGARVHLEFDELTSRLASVAYTLGQQESLVIARFLTAACSELRAARTFKPN